ncbi:hypothetical protein J2X31_001608 [Flavobacterium arsenatis]|uniref:DUF6265 domain-containing protein n=1 Tax=Flavobacterium arsenatis TaxID=1484332 RepID=A0ABU1TNS6_9FLAO|nr:DUF6265 family protein [Flavobacterium arsenatis]MDR6967596.1 hypothetical protein [Flavobacterium arsenatis]
MKKSLYLSVLLVAIISCKKETTVEQPTQPEKQFAALEKANWFLGRWENNSPEGNLSEIWKKENDSTFFGESYFVIKNDTVFAERVSLEERNGKLSCVVTVPNQNDAKPVAFELTSAEANSLIFENPKHDYPNKIIYNQVGKDSLVAEIRGIKDGKEKNEFFRMKKVE